MSSDLLVTYLTIPRKKKPNLKAGERAIQKLSKTPAWDWPEGFLDYMGGDSAGTMHDTMSPLDEAAKRNEFVHQVKADFKDLLVHLDPPKDGRGLRDIAELEIGPLRVILSGGLSGGDSPTESFDVIERLKAAKVTDAMGFDLEENRNWIRIV
jgi:hypothetical protein